MRMFTRITSDERGATAVLIAGILVFMMGFAWLAIDAGLGLDDRRGTQNAADLAALAAAWEYCNPVSGTPNAATAAQAGQDAADANGYADASPDYPQVTITNSGSTWTVDITERNDTVFGAAANAPKQIDIAATATAQCVEMGILGNYAVFGSTDQCPTGVTSGGSGFWDVDLRAGSITVMDGDIHANDDVRVQPSSGWSIGADDEITYVDAASLSGGPTGTQVFARIDEADIIDLTMAEYQLPGGARAVAADSAGDYHDFGGSTINETSITTGPMGTPLGTMNGSVLEIEQPGIYYTSGTINFSNPIRLTGDALTEGVTFVSRGLMHFKRIDNLVGYDNYASSAGPPVAMFSDYGSASCTDQAIDIDGVGAVITGVIYAPDGQVYVGSPGGSVARPTNFTHAGTIVAHWVTVDADTIQLEYRDDPTEPRQYRVELLD